MSSLLVLGILLGALLGHLFLLWDGFPEKSRTADLWWRLVKRFKGG